jgi:hypothetical protein
MGIKRQIVSFFFIKAVLFPCWNLRSQVIPLPVEPLIENSAGADLPAALDEDPFEDWTRFLEHPLLLNEASKDQLQRSGLLPDILIDRLLLHRQLFGPLLHLNELQAIAGFSPVFIRQLKPYVRVASPGLSPLSDLMGKGIISHDIVVRVSGLGSKRINNNANWIGKAQGILFWHRLQKNRWQAGWLVEKDPGEVLLRKRNPLSDHSGFHFFYQGEELIRAVAIGDFTVNLGQGLLQWQSMAFGKSAEMSWFKRQGAVLRPHRSSGEVNFHRGVATTLQWRSLSFSFFISRRSLSGRALYDAAGHRQGIGSISTSGYHRTPSERSGRNALLQSTTGGRLSLRWKSLELSLNTVGYHFSLPLMPNGEPRNVFDVRGKNWLNASADFSFTQSNVHGFGEVALDANRALAWVFGLIITPAPTIDLFFLTRQVSLRYRSMYANAFMESSSVETERGVFGGLTFRPTPQIRIESFADLYLHPWLRYRLNAPAVGKDYLVQLFYRPQKKTELMLRFRKGSKQEINLINTEDEPISAFPGASRVSGRGQVSYLFTKRFSLRARVEWLRISPFPTSESPRPDRQEESGFLFYADLSCKRILFGFDGSFRWQFFDTKSYESRIYAITPYLRPGFGVAAFYGAGSNCWINLSKALKNNALFSLQSQYSLQKKLIKVQDLRLQLRLKFH